MHYLKPKFLACLLALAGLGMVAVRADTTDGASGPYFKGQMSTCLSRTATVYPCISMSPPGYQSNLGSGIVAPAAGLDLPLDTGARDIHWLAKLRSGEFWNPTKSLSRQLQGMKMDFSVGRAGAGMNMNLGPLKLNVLNDDGHLSESRFFLDIEHSW